MSIVTKSGDDGKTRLLSGERVQKYHPLIEANGDLDELISFLGVSKASVGNLEIANIINAIQQDLFSLSAEIAMDTGNGDKLKKGISEESIKTIEEYIYRFEEKSVKIKKFITPGKNLPSSFLDISRAIARRAERKAAKLLDDELIMNKNILIYLNRLSDLLFLLARFMEE